jgi:hypothetical protein
MIVIGIDAHKHTHTMAAADAGGRKLGEKTLEATTAGHLAALRWAHTEFGREIVWAVEDSRPGHRASRPAGTRSAGRTSSPLVTGNQTFTRPP